MDILLSKRLVLCLCALVLLSGSSAAEPNFPPLRIGFASNMFSDMNENDARASIKVWGQLVAKRNNCPHDLTTQIFRNYDELLQSLKEKKVDAVGLLMTDFDKLRRKTSLAPIFLPYLAGKSTDRYILLVHRDSPIKSLADLRKRSIQLLSNSNGSLAPMWLDLHLNEQGLPTASQFAGKIVSNTKLSNVVLSVFFRQYDACVVTHSGFNTMSELNPQLAKQLIVLAESPELVVGLFAFRADYNPPFKEQLITSISNLQKTLPGRQILTIFHINELRIQPPASLKTSLDLIEKHKQIARRNR